MSKQELYKQTYIYKCIVWISVWARSNVRLICWLAVSNNWFQHHANIWSHGWDRKGVLWTFSPQTIALLWVTIVCIALPMKSCYILCEARCLPLSRASFIAITEAIVPALQSDILFHISKWNKYFWPYLKMYTYFAFWKLCVKNWCISSKIWIQIYCCINGCAILSIEVFLWRVSKMKQISFVLQRERESWDFCLKIQFGTSLKR